MYARLDYIAVRYFIHRSNIELRPCLARFRDLLVETLPEKKVRLARVYTFKPETGGEEILSLPIYPVSGRAESVYDKNPDRLSSFMVSVWGSDADHWPVLRALLDTPEGVVSYPTRIDIRTENTASIDFHRLYADVMAHKGNRNIHLFSSRVRTKAEKRGAGGQGLAVGSHGSDLRVTVYKRANEAPACEAALTGGRFFTAAYAAIAKYVGGSSEKTVYAGDNPAYQEFHSRMAEILSASTVQATGFTAEELLDADMRDGRRMFM